jgi:hypothetical protein
MVMSRKSEYPASDEMYVWAQSLSGMITKIKTEYGGISEMVERPDWDDRKTRMMLTLLKGLKSSISKAEKELADHVSGKVG